MAAGSSAKTGRASSRAGAQAASEAQIEYALLYVNAKLENELLGPRAPQTLDFGLTHFSFDCGCARAPPIVSFTMRLVIFVFVALVSLSAARLRLLQRDLQIEQDVRGIVPGAS